MSRVYFNSPSGTAELLGSERAHLCNVVDNIATGALHLDGSTAHARLLPLIHPGNWMAREDTTSLGWGITWGHRYALAFRSLDEYPPLIQLDGEPVSTLSLRLNTACVLGNDAVRLAARIDGQCNIHCWVDGPNRPWLAAIVQQGLDAGIFRKGFWYQPEPGAERAWQSSGWPEVLALLQARDDEPVVLSYSGGVDFPDSSIGGWMLQCPDGVDVDDHADAWYELPAAEQWRISMAGLREREAQRLELKPDDWQAYRFSHCLSVLDLMADDWEDQVRAAVG